MNIAQSFKSGFVEWGITICAGLILGAVAGTVILLTNNASKPENCTSNTFECCMVQFEQCLANEAFTREECIQQYGE